MEDKMKDNYKTTEVWYPYNGGGEMIELDIYDPQTGMPLANDSKLVTVVKE